MTTQAFSRHLMGLPAYITPKHKLRIVSVSDRATTNAVHFKCDNCPSNVSIERSVIRKLLTENNTYLRDREFGEWKVCRGRK